MLDDPALHRSSSRWMSGPRLLAVVLACASAGPAPAARPLESAAAIRLEAAGGGAEAQMQPAAEFPGEGRTAPAGDRRTTAAPQELPEPGHAFYFTRGVYTGGRGFRGAGAWATDFPKADRQFLFVLSRLLRFLDAYEGENPVRLDDPELRRFPFLYVLEVGYMTLTDPEVEGLRAYLEAGGFLLVDDFWGTREWENFEREISRVLPGRPIVEIPLDHPIFHQFYDIDEILQVPNIGNALRGGPTHERDGYVPHVRGIFDDDGNLMVAINWNTDLGDAWEWSENPGYPYEYSNFAYKMAVNFILYAMTH